MISSSIVKLEDLYVGMATIIRLIDRYGDQFWPIFERLEREIIELESRPARMEKYRK